MLSHLHVPGFAPGFLGALVAALLLSAAIVAVWAILRRRLPPRLAVLALRRFVPVAAIGLPFIVLSLFLRRLPGVTRGWTGHLLLFVWILFAGWITLRLLRVVEDSLRERARARQGGEDPGTRTRLNLLFLWLRVSTVILAAGVALMSFPGVRLIGASLLASAGLLGVVFGMAARPILTNLIAGIQLAITQPLRLGDVVSVAGHQGEIRDIRATYVVVQMWDGRRFLVPLTIFVEQPFENLTHGGRELLGTVALWVDHGVPLEGLRAELARICAASRDWDGRTCSLAVSDASPQGMQITAVVGSPDGNRTPSLCAEVREGLLAYLRRAQPEALPRLRSAAAENSGRADGGP